MNTTLKKGNLQYTQGSVEGAPRRAGFAKASGWTARLALVAVVLAWLAPSAFAQAETWYSATTAPPSVVAGTNNTHSFTIENCGVGSPDCSGEVTSPATRAIQSMTVAIPAGFTMDELSCGISTTAGDSWSIVFNGSLIEIAKVSSTKLSIGESLTLTCDATAPCDAGFYEWTTIAYNGDDFTTPWDIASSQPEVEVTGSCEPPGEFEEDDYCSYTQGGWGSPPNGGNPGMILADNFDSLYTNLVIGSGFTMTFESAPDVEEYLPAGGTPGVLAGDVLNPTSTSAGVFGAQVTALRLNVDLNDAGIIDGVEGTISGLVLQNTGTSLDGMTVAQILAVAELALGAGGTPGDYSVSNLNALVDQLNKAFDNCIPTDWAIDHLVAPPG